MEERIAARTIGRETLVWREGLADWRPIAEQPEFETLFAPLPALPSEAGGARAVAGGDELPSASDSFLENLGADTVTRLKAGPWSRFFARQIDMLLWSFPMGFGLGLGLLALPPKLYADIMASNDVVFLLPTLFLAFVVNAIVIAVFGNSVGKRLFGLKAQPIRPMIPARDCVGILGARCGSGSSVSPSVFRSSTFLRRVGISTR